MELLRSTAEGLWRRRSQLSLTVCGIAIGVFSVLVISAIGAAGQGLVGSELEKLGFDCITVSASQGELNALTGEELAAIAALEEVAVAAPLSTSISRAVMRNYAGEVLLCGVDQNVGQIIDLELKNGRLLEASDISAGANYCIIDEELAYAFYRRNTIVGKEMEVTVDQGTEVFTIIGVVDGESNILKNLAGDYVPSFVYIPYTAHQSLTRSSVIDQLFIKVSEDTSPEEAGERVTALLNSAAGYKNLYRYDDLAIQKERLESILGGITLVLSAIGGISLVVSGLSIMTTMTMAVRERTREIGGGSQDLSHPPGIYGGGGASHRCGELFGGPCQRAAGPGGGTAHRPGISPKAPDHRSGGALFGGNRRGLRRLSSPAGLPAAPGGRPAA